MADPPNLKWIVLGGAFITITSVMVVLWTFPERSQLALERAGVADAAGAVAESVAGIAGDAATPVLSRLGLAEQATAPADTPLPPAEPPAAPTRPVARPSRPAPATPDPAFVPPLVFDEQSAASAASEPVAESTAATAAEPVVAVAVDEHVYSSSDTDVVPPRALQALFPKNAPVGADPERLGVVEFVVNQAGDVEVVALVRGPQDVLDGMVLPAIKAWRFDPATKDGRPVRYRQTVLLTY